MPMLTNTKFVERRYHVRPVMMKGEDATAFLPLVFFAIRSMSAIGIICHWSLAPPAATRFRSSIIIAVIVLRACRQALPCGFDAKSPAANHHGVVGLGLLVYLIFLHGFS